MSTYNITISSDLEPLIPRYLDNRKADIERLTASLAEGKIDDIRALGHTLKGSGTSFGLDAISTFGRELEDAAKAANTVQIQHVIDDLATFLARVEITFVDEA